MAAIANLLRTEVGNHSLGLGFPCAAIVVVMAQKCSVPYNVHHDYSGDPTLVREGYGDVV